MEKLVPLMKDGQPVSLAVSPSDFHRKKLVRKGEHEMETYAAAGYRLSDRYEDGTEYDGPKTKAAFEKAANERNAPKPAKDDAVAAAPPDAVSVTVAGDAGPSRMGDAKKGA